MHAPSGLSLVCVTGLRALITARPVLVSLQPVRRRTLETLRRVSQRSLGRRHCLWPARPSPSQLLRPQSACPSVLHRHAIPAMVSLPTASGQSLSSTRLRSGPTMQPSRGSCGTRMAATLIRARPRIRFTVITLQPISELGAARITRWGIHYIPTSRNP